MRFVFMFLICSLTWPAFGRDVFRCDEPKGVAMWSRDGHKPVDDGFKGVSPVVIIDGDVMTVVWGDSGGGTEKAWKAVVFHRSPESVSAVTVIEGPGGSTKMLYTVDFKRHLLYYSAHRENPVLGSTANMYVSKCN